MRSGNLRRELSYLNKTIDGRAEKEDVPFETILSLCGLLDVLIVEAEEKLEHSEALTIDDRWLLNIFGVCGEDKKFIRAFTRICNESRGNPAQIYSLSNTFFYQNIRAKDKNIYTEDEFSKLMSKVISEVQVNEILLRLKAHDIVK